MCYRQSNPLGVFFILACIVAGTTYSITHFPMEVCTVIGVALTAIYFWLVHRSNY